MAILHQQDINKNCHSQNLQNLRGIVANRAWLIGGVGGLLLSPVAVAYPTDTYPTAAYPTTGFQPYFQQIRESLPPNYEMRLPSDIVLTAGPGLDPSELIIKLLPSHNPPRLTIGLFTCNSSPFPCLVGGISVEGSPSRSAQRQLYLHRVQGMPVTLASGVRGYLREGKRLKPASEFSSLMWQQDSMIYTLSFLAAERDNIITMGRSMAAQVSPLQSVQPSIVNLRSEKTDQSVQPNK
jgi:hypothetical protein